MQVRRREKGTVVVEFALVLPFLLFLLFGFLFVGVSVHGKIDTTQVAAMGARYIAVGENPGTALSLTMPDYLKDQLDTQDLKDHSTVCISYPSGTTVGQAVRVQISYSPDPLSAFLQSNARLGVVSIPVTSTAQMRLEAVPSAVPAGCST